ncbi:MAG: putative signal transducing protein [Planctomycetota bacterium]|jgi:hypothetical protein
MDETVVTVATFGDTLQAELAKAKLESAGIVSVVHEDATHQLYGYATGGVRLQVKESERERAAELLGLAEREPKAEVVACSCEGDVSRIVVRFDMLPVEPAAPASLYSLAEGSEEEFELHKVVAVAPNAVTFETYESDAQPEVGATYVFRRWWEQDQLDLVKNENIVWRRERFESSDTVEYEECGLCWQTISAVEAEHNFGYTDGTEWLCERCYDKYIISGFRKKLG